MAALGLHKPGQGYWVRVMTAAAIGLITFATAGWLMGQMNVLASKLPVHTWTADIGAVTEGAAKVGDKVSLVKVSNGGAGKAETLGTATVLGYEPNSSVVRIGNFEPAPVKAADALTPRADDATAFAPVAAGGPGFSAQVKNGVRGIPMIQGIYLQGIAAAVVLLGGALVAFFFCGMKAGSVDFLISTDMEMKKVAWSTRKDITTSTLVVVGASFLLAGVLFGIDVALQFFFRAIHVLQ